MMDLEEGEISLEDRVQQALKNAEQFTDEELGVDSDSDDEEAILARPKLSLGIRTCHFSSNYLLLRVFLHCTVTLTAFV